MCRATAKNNSLEKSIIDCYNSCKNTTLADCYVKPSENKKALYDYYKSECVRLGGKGFKIIFYNALHISFAYYVNGKLIIIKPSRRIHIECEWC